MRVIPEPAQCQEEFDSDDFFANEPAVPSAPDADDEIGTGFEFARSAGGLKRSALKLLRIR